MAHPIHIQHVLQDQPDRYHKGASVARIKPLFSEGLTTSLAMLEMLVILAMIAQMYELHLVPRYPVEPAPLITLRPRHSLLVTLRQRRSAR